jgi:hypothetical protein
MSMIRLGDRNTSRGISSPRTGTSRGRGLNAENPNVSRRRGLPFLHHCSLPESRLPGMILCWWQVCFLGLLGVGRFKSVVGDRWRRRWLGMLTKKLNKSGRTEFR